MTDLAHSGISVELPEGWEGTITGGGFPVLADGAVRPTVLQMASFPLPADPGSFGSEAVEAMGGQDVFVTLFEYGPESAGTPLFDRQGVPRQLEPAEFDRAALQRGLPGQSGLQVFFTEAGRAFCLYVVLGSHLDRSELVPRVEQVLATLEIE